ncbi:Spherulation-specific family 4 [Mycena vitilis]|nr:Spherulation-specific family 4 [Mycena vitilis]
MLVPLLFLAIALRPVTALLAKGVIFPLYVYPDLVFDDGCAAWAPVFSAITANPTLPFLIVANPNSGPGDANTQPDSNYQTCITNLKSNANVRVIGYVKTGFGARSSADVTADISTYAQWTDAYRPTGIFFDETLATAEFVSQYQSFATAVRSSALGSTAFVTVNPGDTPVDDFYTFSDLVVSAENFYSSFSASQLVISTASPASKQSVILHDAPSTTPVSLVDQLVGDGIPYIFVTEANYTTIPVDLANFCKAVVAAQA